MGRAVEVSLGAVLAVEAAPLRLEEALVVEVAVAPLRLGAAVLAVAVAFQATHDTARAGGDRVERSKAKTWHTPSRVGG